MFEHYYHKTTRKAIIAMGTLLNNIKVVREDRNGIETNRETVPLSYLTKRKMFRILEEDSKADESKIDLQAYFPRMTFAIVNILRNPTRASNPFQKLYNQKSDGSVEQILFRNPYSLTFEVSINTKKQDDLWQIVEQILPYFNPSLTMSVRSVDNFEAISDDFLITLEDVTPDLNVEGTPISEQLEVYTVTLTFSVDLYYYGPRTSSGLIKNTNVTFKDQNNGLSLVKVTAEINPNDATIDDFGISTGILLLDDQFITSAIPSEGDC